MNVVYVGVFGVLGVLVRYGIGVITEKYFMSGIPGATFAINLVGAFLIGLVYVAGVEQSAIPANLRLGLMVGFLGGFTTFSAYCLEAFQLIEAGRYFVAAAYLGLSPTLGLGLTLVGVRAGRMLFDGVN